MLECVTHIPIQGSTPWLSQKLPIDCSLLNPPSGIALGQRELAHPCLYFLPNPRTAHIYWLIHVGNNMYDPLCFGETAMNHWSFTCLQRISWIFCYISIEAQLLPLSIPVGLTPSQVLIRSKLNFLHSNICPRFCSTINPAWPKTVDTRICMVQGNTFFKKDSGSLSPASQVTMYTPLWVVNGVLTFPSIINATAQLLKQWSPTFLAPGTGFVKDNFSTDRSEAERGGRGRRWSSGW